MPQRLYNALFLCTGNSARSLMAECALERWGAGRFRAFSAGSQPKPAPHPTTLAVLTELGYDTSRLRSKGWDEFARPESPPLDFVFTVCDRARGESCPLWTGTPLTAHWGVEDPAAFEGSNAARRRLFRHAYFELEYRVKAFASLAIDGLTPSALQGRLDEIGKAPPPAEPEP